ncbi:MAG TPA: ABC transporter substrate-binding protein [Actinomycetota bacterium]|nr:ABC transporter substrate-binding protein [Actinomycetota bacterium]
MRWKGSVRLTAVVLLVSLLTAACGGDGGSSDGRVELRLGYFPNLTHAPALLAVEKRYFAQELGANVALKTATFNAGNEAVQALFANQLDITYIGPNPAINAYAQSKGAAVRIISGSTSGGAALVVKPSITSAGALKGKKLATPQLGNTQDVALRSWLGAQGINVTKEGGQVTIVAQQNAQTLDTFKAGAIDGAWVPEPWATRLQLEGGGVVLVDEKTLWPDGKFVTTHIIVRTEFLNEHKDVVEAFLRGHVKAVRFAGANPDVAKSVANAAIGKLTGKPLGRATIDSAWSNLEFTVDPIASSLRKSAEDAQRVGLLDPVNLDRIYALETLNEVLQDIGESPIAV